MAVIAGMIPIDLLAQERTRIYDRSAEVGRTEAADEARRQTLQTLQESWRAGTKGRWTHLLIQDIMRWLGREHEEVNFYLTQFLTGHGYFRYYLNKLCKVNTPRCKYCGYEKDDAEHTFFACSRWADERQRLEVMVGKTDGTR